MRNQEVDLSVDVLQTILWHYNKAERIQKLLQAKSNWYAVNHRLFWERWIIDVFNLETANEFGLSVWAIILKLPLFLGAEPDDPDKPIWGFGDNNLNFGHGNFARANGGMRLDIEEKRLLLRLRYFQLISRAAIPETNEFFSHVFAAYGPVYVLDGLDMSIVVVFTEAIPWRLQYILKKFDLIMRGSGVKLRYRFNPTAVFGFGPNNKNFGHGTFFSED
jgi:hypothetical protein